MPDAFLTGARRVLHDDALQFVIDTDRWNRMHPTDPPIPFDDPDGKLAAALEYHGLSLAAIIERVIGAPTSGDTTDGR